MGAFKVFLLVLNLIEDFWNNISSRTYLRKDGNNEELLTTSLNAFTGNGLLKYGLAHTSSSET